MPLDELAIGFENGVGSGAVCLQVAANGIDHRGLQLAQLAQFELQRGSQFVAAALIDQGLEWRRTPDLGV
jgi:hypothetical protein